MEMPPSQKQSLNLQSVFSCAEKGGLIVADPALASAGLHTQDVQLRNVD